MREHKVLRAFLCAIALIFVLHQIYSSVYKPITTVSAEYASVIDGLNITGVIIREERIITNGKSGALHFLVSDGSRVSKNGVVADIYSSADTSVTVSRIAQINQRIADIEEMQGYNDVQAADLGLANNKVNVALNEMIRNSAAGNYSSAEQDTARLLTNINRRQMITGEQTDFSLQLDALRSELANLSASLPTPVGEITADTSGYFVSNVDGFETVLSCKDIENITPESIDSLQADDIPDGAIGKIVSGYEWYIAAKVSFNESLQYKQGDALTISTTLKSSPELSVRVERINVSEDSENAVLIFSCQQMNSELASMRTDSMKIIKNTYKGLKVPKKSLRVNDDGEPGVYVRSGITLKFVKVNVIHQTDDYIICEQQTSVDDVLRLYDEVVIKGKRLYDGKIVD